MVCSGDAGVYGMASLMYEISKEHPAAELTIIPGITAALSGGAVLGSPLSNDFCTSEAIFISSGACLYEMKAL